MVDYTITALGDDVNIHLTTYQGAVVATYEEIRSLFIFNVGMDKDPEYSFEDARIRASRGYQNVHNEFRVEMSVTGDDVEPEYWKHKLVATIYDWKPKKSDDAMKGYYHWRVGGHESCVEGYINDMVKRQRKVLTNG